MKINIGGGFLRYDGFVNLDLDPATNPDYVVNLETDRLPFDDNTVEEVKAYHILEHIGSGFFHLFKELYRVCKDGAIIDIHVPHHRHENFYGDLTHIRPITILNMMQLSKKYLEAEKRKFLSSSGHCNVYDFDFEIIEHEQLLDTHWSETFKNLSQQEIDEISRNFNNVYSETWIKMMVIK